MHKYTVNEVQKLSLETKVLALVNSEFAPQITAPPPDYEFNYIDSLFHKWRGNSLSLLCKYKSNHPNRLSDSFEVGYTKIECNSPKSYSLSYFRHTGKWHKVYSGLSLEETLQAIQNEQIFHPSL